MITGKTEFDYSAGEKVSHAKFGEGFIRVLKPFDKSYVEFNSEDIKNSRCLWINNSELIKAN